MPRQPASTAEERIDCARRLITLLTDTPATVTTLAIQLDMKRENLYRTCTQLARAGLIHSRAGRTGGGVWRNDDAIITEEALVRALGYKKPQRKPYLRKAPTLKAQKAAKLCRLCGRKLPVFRYFHCPNCAVASPDLNEEFLYYT